MEYRELGKTGMKVSVLGFGASPLGGVFGAIDEADGIRAVHVAIERGVNFFDVSPFYGITKAETVLGKALATVPRDKFTLSTKVGRYGPTEFDFSAERVTRSVEESLQRLPIGYIDLILCHDIEFASIEQVVTETIPTLRKLQAQGKVRFIGVSGLPLKVYREVLGQTDLDTILSYCHYTLNDTSLEELIPTLQAKEVGIINAAPLSMGLLTQEGPPVWHPAPEALQVACRQAAEHCRRQGVDISTLALQFALANPVISSTFIGMASSEVLVKNLSALESPLDTTLVAEVQAILQPVRNLSWPSGRPENNE